MLEISKPIIVEGKYDRERILSVAEATVITTDGFGIFKKDEKKTLIRRLASKCGVIVMTDSDGAGLVIRGYINGILPANSVTHIYIPEIYGKEKRKKEPSKQGLLGVEGMEREWLISALSPFSGTGEHHTEAYVSKSDFFALGLSGGEMSAEKRKRLALLLGLPTNLSCSALVCAINLLISEQEFNESLQKLGSEEIK